MAKRLSAAEAWQLAQPGKALIVDLRGPADFARAHLRGSLSLPYSEKSLADRLDILAQNGTPIIILGGSRQESESAERQLSGGAFPVVGVIDEAARNWEDFGLPVETLGQVSVQETTEAALDPNTVVLDVREPVEWEIGHVPGALLVSLGTLRHRLDEVPRGARIAVICEAGVRSSSAASLLRRSGFAKVLNVLEGTSGYRKAGLPLQFPSGGTN